MRAPFVLELKSLTLLFYFSMTKCLTLRLACRCYDCQVSSSFTLLLSVFFTPHDNPLQQCAPHKGRGVCRALVW